MTEENPIIEEIRRTREQMLAEHNGDLDSLVTELQGLSIDRIRAGRPLAAPPERSRSNETVPVKKVG